MEGGGVKDNLIDECDRCREATRLRLVISITTCIQALAITAAQQVVRWDLKFETPGDGVVAKHIQTTATDGGALQRFPLLRRLGNSIFRTNVLWFPPKVLLF